MPTDRELMQQALDALEKHVLEYETVKALRARLAQPYAAQAAMVDQQTQGRMYVDPVTGDVGIGNPNQVTLDTSGATGFKLDASAPLVVHPHPAFQATQQQRVWKELSTAEVKVLWNLTKKPSEFAAAIQAKLREKNEKAA